MNISMFEILGPVMIGPSSSHTAGAQRIGKAMYMIVGEEKIAEVHFNLHGSFHLTLKGHGTDRALVGGILGLDSCDPAIRDSLQLADEAGLLYTFEGADLGDVHPNTVKIVATAVSGKTYSLVGSSIGGGNIEIVEINGIRSRFSGKFPSVVITHMDTLGIVSRIAAVFASSKNNIVALHHTRENKGKAATTMVETDGSISREDKLALSQLENVHDVVCMEKFI